MATFNRKGIAVEYTEPKHADMHNINVGNFIAILKENIEEEDEGRAAIPAIIEEKKWYRTRIGVPFEVLALDLPFVLVSSKCKEIGPVVMDIRCATFIHCDEKYVEAFYKTMAAAQQAQGATPKNGN